MNHQIVDRVTACLFQNVLYIPDLGFQLISVPMIDKHGFITVFGHWKVKIVKSDKIIATGPILKEGLYVLDESSEFSQREKALAASLKTCHHRLALVNPAAIERMIK